MDKPREDYQCNSCKMNLIITNISDFKIGESFPCAVCYDEVQVTKSEEK